MGTYTIILEDTPEGQVGITACGKPREDEQGNPTMAQELFIALLETLEAETEGGFRPEIKAHH